MEFDEEKKEIYCCDITLGTAKSQEIAVFVIQSKIPSQQEITKVAG
jgi:hypothetical protein